MAIIFPSHDHCKIEPVHHLGERHVSGRQVRSVIGQKPLSRGRTSNPIHVRSGIDGRSGGQQRSQVLTAGSVLIPIAAVVSSGDAKTDFGLISKGNGGGACDGKTCGQHKAGRSGSYHALGSC